MMRERMIIAGLLIMFSAMASQLVFSDDDDHRDYGDRSVRKSGVRPVDNAQYREECGSCHFAYQPGLLPAASWNKIMGGLADHFGDNAELDAGTHRQISEYLQRYSADVDAGEYRRSKKLADSALKGDVPLRITEVSYFRRKHHEVPARVIKSDKIGSLSRCDACHSRADEGSFREREISIPGYGRWED